MTYTRRGWLIGALALVAVAVIVVVTRHPAQETQPAGSAGSAPARDAIEVSASPIDAANEGRLVVVSGRLRIDQPARDPDLGVSADALQLSRHVEMFQWRETCTADACRHAREWSPRLIDSSGFKKPQGHSNPPGMPFANATFFAGDITLGDFHVDPTLAADGRKPADWPIDIRQLPPNLAATFRNADGALYAGQDPDRPQVGDLRVSYRVVKAGDARLTGMQQGRRLVMPTEGDKQP